MVMRYGLGVLFSMVLTLVILSSSPEVHGAIGCSATVTPHTVSPNSSTNFQIQINNTDSDSITWVRITRPSGNFVITSNGSSGWASSTTEEYAYQSDGVLDPGQSMVVDVTATAVNAQVPSADWIVETTDTPGLNLVSCNGDLGTSISGQVADTTPPNIYNISVSNLRTSSVTISWLTSEPATSKINYGYDDQYGSSTNEDLTLKTNHSMQITGLSPGEAYHYQVVGQDSNANQALSGDNTFLTPLVDPVSQTPEDVITPIGDIIKTKIPIKAIPTEKIPPEVSISTNLDKPFKEAPILTGNARDNEALAGIHYSTDGGKNWLQVDKDQGLGTVQATFSFKPLNLDDGNYQIIVRAIDTSGNIGLSGQKTLVIDRLPPQVGGSVISSGPQIFQPNNDGVIYSLVGVDQKVTVSAVGGPTSILVTAKKNGNSSTLKTFNLTKSPDTGLWSGIISFQEQGDYTLVADSLDGAGNKTSKVIGLAQALAPARVTNNKNSLKDAKVTLYYLEPTTNVWTVWDGASYGQLNPQTTNEKGQFNLFVPEGKYYLKVDAEHYRTLISDVFEIKGSMPILSSLKMKEAININIGKFSIHIPPFSNDRVQIDPPKLSYALPPTAKKLINKQAPDFELKDTNGKLVKSSELTGRPTVITFISSWSPPSREQLYALSQLQKNKDINVIPVVIHENSGKINAIVKISGIQLEILTDPDGTMVDKFGIQTLPAHYVLDRRGVVKSVTVGVLSEEKINDALSGGQ